MKRLLHIKEAAKKSPQYQAPSITPISKPYIQNTHVL